VVEPGLPPAVGESPGVEYLDRETLQADALRVAAPVRVPGVRLAGLPGRIAAQPARRAKIRLKDQDAGLAQGHVRHGGHPKGCRPAIILDVDRDDVPTRLQERG